ncbi:HPP family protein [Phakopsora pachyrhizi]|uniref:HPP family protein n=1 Tax=Phakopsora pachyrhizi TaxID=170000 RepID=A0AAV0AW95_PHAPC|nr:HPP family protein [Phakopsora pachyrhizi]CAH7673297.1 HPP family protein [Phakopsora pachyrhizi]
MRDLTLPRDDSSPTLQGKEEKALLLKRLYKSSKNFESKVLNYDIRPGLPYWVSRFLGYRSENESRPIWLLKWMDKFRVPNLLESCLCDFFASFTTILLICTVFSTTSLAKLPIPIVLAPAGAVVISIYGYPLAPVSSPRNVLLGQFWASLVSSIVTKILLDHNTMTVTVERGEMGRNLVWLAACLSLAITIVVQNITRSLHPPGGATAVLGSVSPGIVEIGFKYIGLVMAMVLIILGLALIIQNISRRRYPMYWLSPPKTEAPAKSYDPEKGLAKLKQMVSEMITFLEESDENSEIRSMLAEILEKMK